MAEAAAVTVAVAVAAVSAGCGVVLVLCPVAGVAVAATVPRVETAAASVSLVGYGCTELRWGAAGVGWALVSSLVQGVAIVGWALAVVGFLPLFVSSPAALAGSFVALASLLLAFCCFLLRQNSLCQA